MRKRSVENVLAEIKSVTTHYPVKTLRFEDDLFGVRRNWLFEFCEKYPRRFNLPFICSLRADNIDEDVVKGLKEAGCFNVVMGVESGDDYLRNQILKKKITDEQLLSAAELFHRYNLNFCTTNILGLPGETLETALKTISFNLKLKPAFTWCSVFQPYPRTELGNLVIRDRLTKALDVDDIEPNYHSRSLLNQKDIRRSVNLHKFFYVIFRHPRLLPLATRLSALPPNIFFTMIHRISFLLIYAKRWNIPLHRAIKEGMKSTGFTRSVKRKPETGHVTR